MNSKMKMLNESYLSGPFFSIQANISSNNKFCSAHTLNHLYWDYCSLCRLMSMEKACSACILLMNFGLPPTHAYIHRIHRESRERERDMHGHIQLMGICRACVFFSSQFCMCTFSSADFW